MLLEQRAQALRVVSLDRRLGALPGRVGGKAAAVGVVGAVGREDLVDPAEEDQVAVVGVRAGQDPPVDQPPGHPADGSAFMPGARWTAEFPPLRVAGNGGTNRASSAPGRIAATCRAGQAPEPVSSPRRQNKEKGPEPCDLPPSR